MLDSKNNATWVNYIQFRGSADAMKMVALKCIEHKDVKSVLKELENQNGITGEILKATELSYNQELLITSPMAQLYPNDRLIQ